MYRSAQLQISLDLSISSAHSSLCSSSSIDGDFDSLLREYLANPDGFAMGSFLWESERNQARPHRPTEQLFR